MTYKVVFLDIDGTILKPDHTYTKSTVEAIEQLKEQGIEVFLATGRPLHEIHDLAKELNIDAMIGYNGAAASYKGKTIVHEPMESKSVQQIIETSKKYNHEFVMYTNESNFYSSSNPIVEHFSKVFQMDNNQLYTPEVIHQILGITVMNVEPKEANNYELNPSIQLSQVNIDGVRHAYDVIRKQVNKGFAVKKVLDHLGIPVEQSIAFGDGLNDKEMLQVVGEGFAMGNANPDLLPYAKHQTTTVEESGIFHGLQKLGLVK